MTTEVIVAELKLKIKYLEEKAQSNERKYLEELSELREAFHERISDLETKSSELESRIRLGKGIFIGIIVTLGTIGSVAANKISSFFASILKIFNI